MLRSCRRVARKCKRSDRGRCPTRRPFRCRSSNGKLYDMPRRNSRAECVESVRGFSKRASCAPFRGASKKKITRRKNQKMNREISVLGTQLQRCSEPGMPTTGYTRDGVCSMHKGDAGSHHVCLKDIGGNEGTSSTESKNFCSLTGQSNWCETKEDWCVCEWAFDKAVQRAGCDAFEIKCGATNMRALDHYERAGLVDATNCIRAQCGINTDEN